MTATAIDNDPDDVACWLEALEWGIRVAERKIAAQRAHLELCRGAASAAMVSPNPETIARLSVLMHGEIINAAPDEQVEPATLPSEPWTPPTREQRLQREHARILLNGLKGAAERQRRIKLAERRFGTPYEGVDPIELTPSRKLCPDCGHRFAGSTHAPGGNGCAVMCFGLPCGCMTDPCAHGMKADGSPASEAWRASIPSDEEFAAPLRHAEPVVRCLAATRITETTMTPQHQDETRER